MEFDAGGDMTSWVGIAYAAITLIAGWIYRWGKGLREEGEKLAEKLAAHEKAATEKFQQLELKLATAYHSKDDLDDILDLKLKPLLDMLVDIKERLRDKENGRGHVRGA